MKNLLSLIITILTFCPTVMAQKASDNAKEEAKNYLAQGWKVNPGALPLARQLDKSYRMIDEKNYDGSPVYVFGEAISVGKTYQSAKVSSSQLAKENLAENLQTEITAIIQQDVANNQLNSEEAESVTRIIMAAKSLITQSIGRTITAIEVYRPLPNKNVEVLVRIAYNYAKAKEEAKDVVKKSLQEDGNLLHEKLDEILGW